MRLRQGKQLPHAHGVYVIGFIDPVPAIYVGIAADDKVKPEGILTRLQKHRVKVTGSHVHEKPNQGSILHPKRWGDFAARRHEAFALRGKVDLLEDVVILTGSLGEGANVKSELQYFEQQLSLPITFSRSTDLCRQLVHALFDHQPSDVYSLNTQRSRSAPLGEMRLVFDGQPPVLLAGHGSRSIAS
jgi:ethanolamine utilization cobalamin adenosyltransferase